MARPGAVNVAGIQPTSIAESSLDALGASAGVARRAAIASDRAPVPIWHVTWLVRMPDAVDGSDAVIYRGNPDGFLWLDAPVVDRAEIDLGELNADERAQLAGQPSFSTRDAARIYLSELVIASTPTTTTTTTTTSPTTTTTTTTTAPATTTTTTP